MGSNPAGGMDVSLVSVLCCQVEVCDGLIACSEESYLVWCVVMCDLENPKNEKAIAHVGP